jgi:hypothetical protein
MAAFRSSTTSLDKTVLWPNAIRIPGFGNCGAPESGWMRRLALMLTRCPTTGLSVQQNIVPRSKPDRGSDQHWLRNSPKADADLPFGSRRLRHRLGDCFRYRGCDREQYRCRACKRPHGRSTKKWAPGALHLIFLTTSPDRFVIGHKVLARFFAHVSALRQPVS